MTICDDDKRETMIKLQENGEDRIRDAQERRKIKERIAFRTNGVWNVVESDVDAP